MSAQHRRCVQDPTLIRHVFSWNTPLSSQPTSAKRPFLGSLDKGDFSKVRKIVFIIETSKKKPPPASALGSFSRHPGASEWLTPARPAVRGRGKAETLTEPHFPKVPGVRVSGPPQPPAAICLQTVPLQWPIPTPPWLRSCSVRGASLSSRSP